MITHVVFFKLKDRSPESVEQARAKLQNMEGKISELLHIEVGADVIHSERSYDLALITKFNSLEDLKAYNVHPSTRMCSPIWAKPKTASLPA